MNPYLSSNQKDYNYLSCEFKLNNKIKLSILETNKAYIINGYFPNFNDYLLDIDYINNFLLLNFFSKISLNFKRMFYIENLNLNEISLFFRNNELSILINK